MNTETPIPYDELPLWMRQAKQEFDWGILIIIAMSLAIGWTFLINNELPAGNSLEHYVFQAHDIATGFQEGVFYPRWSPYTMKGYGAPIPNYYPMGTGYTISVISVLFTNDIYQATRLVFILAYVIAGLGVYLYLSRRTDSAIGLLGSVLYLYSPMIGSTIPYHMGDLALLIASGLLPLTLWSSYRLANYYQALDLILHTVVLGFLIWIHPQMAIVSTILTTALIIVENRDVSLSKRAIRLLLGNLLGFLLVAFFWMPALLERDLVTWFAPPFSQRPILSLDEFFTPMQQIDGGLLLPQPQFKIGWVLFTFGIIGFVFNIRLWRLRTPVNIEICIFAIMLTVIGFGMMPNEVWVLSPITLCIAIIGAHTLSLRQYMSPAGKRLLLAFSLASVVIFSQPVWLVPQPNLTIDNISPIGQIRYEQQGYGPTTVPASAPIPSIVDPNIAINRSLVNSIELEAPQRYNDRQNNANTIVSLLSTTTQQQVYRIFNNFPAKLVFLLPYFEGWQAFLDNEPIPTYADPDSNLLTIDVPIVNDGELVIRLTGTPLRNLAWFISAVALFILTGLSLLRNHALKDVTQPVVATLPRTDIRLLLVMFTTLSIIIISTTSDIPIIRLQSPPTYSLSQSLPLQQRTSAGFEASTFTINTTRAQIGDDIQLTVFWQALTDITTNYQSRALLRSTSTNLNWYIGELQVMGSIQTQRWTRTKFVNDTHRITIPNTVIAGEYEIMIEIVPCQKTCDFNNPVLFFDLNGTAVGRQLIIPLSIIIR